MPRMPLRPALRAYAHAPAGAEAPFLNETSLLLDGTDDSINTSTAWPGLAASDTGYSVSLWARVASGAGNTDYFFSLATQAAFETRLQFRLQTFSGGKATFLVLEGNADASSSSYVYMVTAIGSLVDDRWHHYVVASPGDGGLVYLYMDGSPIYSKVGKALSTGTLNTGGLYVGSTFNSYLWPGNIDDMAIFDKQLDSSEVDAVFNNGVPASLEGHANVEHWWRFGDGDGDTTLIIKDQIGTWDLDTKHNAPVLNDPVARFVFAEGVTPYHGSTSGGTAITIRGHGLSGVASVTVGGVACTGVSATDTTVSCTVASGSYSEGAVDVVVTGASSNNTSTVEDGFYYIASTPAWESTKSLRFNGTSWIFSELDWPELTTNDYSVSWWAQVQTFTSGRYFVYIGAVGPDEDSIPGLGFLSGRVACRTSGTTEIFVLEDAADISEDLIYFTSSGAGVATGWHHYCITSTTGAQVVYVDGVSKGSSTGTDLGTASGRIKSKLVLGHLGYTGVSNIDANMTELALFDSALPAAGSNSVATLYNSGSPADITSVSTLKHYYRCGDGIGDTATHIRDQIGHFDLNRTVTAPTLETDVPT